MSEFWWLGLEHILRSLARMFQRPGQHFAALTYGRSTRVTYCNVPLLARADRSIVLGCLIFIYLFYSALICGGVQLF